MKSLLLFSALVIFWGCGTEVEEDLIYPEDQTYSEDSLETYHPVDEKVANNDRTCLLYTSPSPRDRQKSRMPSSA